MGWVVPHGLSARLPCDPSQPAQLYGYRVQKNISTVSMCLCDVKQRWFLDWPKTSKKKLKWVNLHPLYKLEDIRSNYRGTRVQSQPQHGSRSTNE